MTIKNVIEREDGQTSRLTPIRFAGDETTFLLEVEAFQRPAVKRRGVGPAVHRLIRLARAWDALLAKPLRDYLRAEAMTVEQFAELAELQPATVYDILTLETRQPDHVTVAKVRGVIGE